MTLNSRETIKKTAREGMYLKQIEDSNKIFENLLEMKDIPYLTGLRELEKVESLMSKIIREEDLDPDIYEKAEEVLTIIHKYDE